MSFKLANRGHPFRTYTISHAGGIDSNLLAIQQSFAEQNFANIDRINSRSFMKTEKLPKNSSKNLSSIADQPATSAISELDVSSKCSKVTFIFFDLEKRFQQLSKILKLQQF